MMRRKEVDNKTRLQNGNPMPGCSVGYAEIGSQRGKIHQLPRPSGAEPYKPLEGVHIPNSCNIPHISFHISPVIRGEPVMRLKSLVMYSGIKPLVQYLFKANGNCNTAYKSVTFQCGTFNSLLR